MKTGTWRRLVIDPIFGQVIDHGTTRYRPPTHLADLVIARDGTCGFPPLQPTRPILRPGPSPPVPRRRHQRGEPRARLPPRPPAETPSQLASTAKPRRHHHLDSPQGREYTNHPPARWKIRGE
jgi:hypothetical protein